MTVNKTPIPQRLKNVSADHPYVAGAVDIYDDNALQNQQSINDNTYRKSETYNREQIEYMAATHDENFVNLEAESGDTLADVFDGVTGAAKTLYRVGNWDGEEYNTAKYSQYSFDGTNFVLLQVVNAGIEETPTKDSDKLIESGGVYKNLTMPLNAENKDHVYNDEIISGKYINDSGILVNDSSRGIVFTNVLDGSTVVNSYQAGAYSFYSGYPDYTSGTNFIEKNTTGEVPANAKFVGISYNLTKISGIDVYITQDGNYVTDADLPVFGSELLEPIDDELYEKEELSETSTDLSSQLSPYTEGCGIQYTNGALYLSENYNASDFVDIHSYQKITYKRAKSTMSNTKSGMAFYDSRYRYISGQKFLIADVADGYVETTIDVPANAYYVRVSENVDTTNWGNQELIGISIEYEKTSRIKEISDVVYSYGRELNGDSEEIDTFSFAYGRVVYYTGLTESSENTKYSNYVDISRYAKIKYKRIGVTTNTSKAGIAFYDADKNYISGQQCILSQEERTWEWEEIETPSNAVFARFTWWRDAVGLGSFSITGYLYDVTKSSKIDAIQAEIGVLQEEIDAISGGGEGVDNTLTLGQMDIVEGNVIQYDGKYYSNSSMGCTDFIPCHGAQVLSYTKVVGVPGAGIAFYDSEKNYIQNSFIGGASGTNGVLRTMIFIPEGAYYFRASGWNYTNSLSYGEFYASLSSSEACLNGKRASNGESTFFSVLYNSAIDDLSVTDFTEQSQGRTMICTTGVVLLPPSYTMKGKPSRVIINFHGWSHYVHYKQWGAAGSEYAGFMMQKNRWANAGYVVVDVNHKNSAQGGSYSGLGSIQDDECYRKAWEYVKNNYNVEDTCFIVCGSAGGPNGINACYNWPDVRASVWLDCWIDVAEHPYVNTCGNYYYGYSGSYDATKVGTRNPVKRIQSLSDTDYLFMPKCSVKMYPLSLSDNEFMKPFVDIINAGNAIGDFEIRISTGITHSVLVSGGDGTSPKAEIVDNEIINYLDQH